MTRLEYLIRAPTINLKVESLFWRKAFLLLRQLRHLTHPIEDGTPVSSLLFSVHGDLHFLWLGTFSTRGWFQRYVWPTHLTFYLLESSAFCFNYKAEKTARIELLAKRTCKKPHRSKTVFLLLSYLSTRYMQEVCKTANYRVMEQLHPAIISSQFTEPGWP